MAGKKKQNKDQDLGFDDFFSSSGSMADWADDDEPAAVLPPKPKEKIETKPAPKPDPAPAPTSVPAPPPAPVPPPIPNTPVVEPPAAPAPIVTSEPEPVPEPEPEPVPAAVVAPPPQLPPLPPIPEPSPTAKDDPTVSNFSADEDAFFNDGPELSDEDAGLVTADSFIEEGESSMVMERNVAPPPRPAPPRPAPPRNAPLPSPVPPSSGNIDVTDLPDDVPPPPVITESKDVAAPPAIPILKMPSPPLRKRGEPRSRAPVGPTPAAVRPV
ncbi:MAG: hypothetical protein AAFV53_30225, partial [Myxococcota bacterium]